MRTLGRPSGRPHATHFGTCLPQEALGTLRWDQGLMSVHRVHRGAVLETDVLPDHQGARLPLVKRPSPQRGIQAAPAATVDGREAQMNRRGNHARRQNSVAELEKRVGASAQTLVEQEPSEVSQIHVSLGLGN